MTSTGVVLLLAFLLGAMAGLRAITPLAVLSWASVLGWIHLDGTWLGFLHSKVALVILTLFAVGELINDKLPKTPSRTTPVPLGVRIVMGGVAGSALLLPLHASVAVGALLGAVGGLAGSFVGFWVRRALVRGAKLSDLPVALVEDLVAIAGSLWLVSRF